MFCLVIPPSPSQTNFGKSSVQSTSFNYSCKTPARITLDSLQEGRFVSTYNIGKCTVRDWISYDSFISLVTSNAHIPAENTTQAGRSVSILPSLEHSRFLYPRPRPTILPSSASPSKTTRNKGKAKSKSTAASDSDWTPPDITSNRFDCNSGSNITPAPTVGENPTSSTPRLADSTQNDFNYASDSNITPALNSGKQTTSSTSRPEDNTQHER